MYLWQLVVTAVGGGLLHRQDEPQITETGQGLAEYALILVFVAIVVVVVLALFGPAIGDLYSSVICGVEQTC